ncbi:unnamed protein product [Adineta steineri]|uniref:Uncharacterized protein n=1 Tax=Adineta steineri TaxID=433720 RepID=A0A815UUT4_9BILA|nr:unnamed protein product [Adineta steineri]CAF1636862.1 unnamed protein product [Adineta steineri]
MEIILLHESINLHYPSNINDESEKLLQPIFDYVQEPLVSLEEEYKPLINTVPHISSYIWIEKQNSIDLADSLIQDKLRYSPYTYFNRIKLAQWFLYLKLFFIHFVTFRQCYFEKDFMSDIDLNIYKQPWYEKKRWYFGAIFTVWIIAMIILLLVILNIRHIDET